VPIFLIAKYSDLNHLSALGLGNTILLIIIQTFTYGFATGLTKLVAYSFSDLQYYSIGLHLNRALIVNTGFFIIQLLIILVGCYNFHNL